MKTIMNASWIVLITAGLLLTACQNEENKPTAETKKVALDFSDKDVEAAYGIGLSMSKNLLGNLKGLDDLKLDISKEVIKQGFIDGLSEKPELDDESLGKVMQAFDQRIRTLVKEKEQQLQKERAEKTAAYLKENAAKEGVTTLPSGLQYKIITAGKGAKPLATDKVKVHYRGTLIDGTQFDSSYDRNAPAIFGVSEVIEGWTEALQLMSVGAKWQLVIPGKIAYKEQGRPGTIPPNATLVFDVELLEINPVVEAPKPKTPETAAPKSSEKTKAKSAEKSKE